MFEKLEGIRLSRRKGVVGRMIILKQTLEKWGTTEQIKFIWLWIGTAGGCM
jgi:hypothetical protein